MNVKRFFAAYISVLLLSTLASCQKPIYSEAPEYGKLKFTTDAPSSITLDRQSAINTSSFCSAGDSVTVFIQTAYAGSYITEAEYIWKLQVTNDSVASKTVRVIAPHKQNTPPMWTFKAPSESGKYTVSFKAMYDYSAQTISGQIYGESQSYTEIINVK